MMVQGAWLTTFADTAWVNDVPHKLNTPRLRAAHLNNTNDFQRLTCETASDIPNITINTGRSLDS
jgi:hypothetical protein